MTWGPNAGQGSTRQWRKTRQNVLDRDNHECQYRYPGCTYTATEVHHIHGITAAGQQRNDPEANDEDCCQSICPSCHQKLTDGQRRHAQQQAQKLRAARLRPPPQPHPGD